MRLGFPLAFLLLPLAIWGFVELRSRRRARFLRSQGPRIIKECLDRARTKQANRDQAPFDPPSDG